MSSMSGEELARERVALGIVTVVTALVGTLLSSVLYAAPVPLAVLIYRHGLRPGIITALVAGGVAVFVVGHPAAMMLVLLVLGMGVAIGEALRDELSLRQTLTVSWAVAFLSFAGMYAVSRWIFHVDLIDATVRAWLDQLVRMSDSVSKAPVTEQEISQLIMQTRTVLPSMMALSALVLSVLEYWLTGRWLLRLGEAIPWFPPLARWRFPWYLAWGYIIGLGLPLLDGILKVPILIPIATNMVLFFRFVFLLQGLVVLWFYLMRWNVRKPVAVILLLLSLFATPLFVFVGLLDTWFDLRRLDSI